MKFLKLVSTYFITTWDSKNCRLRKHSQQYSHHISGKIAKWSIMMNIQMKTATFKPSDPISVLSFLNNFKTVCDNKIVHKGTAVWLFPSFIPEPAQAALSNHTLADNKQNHKQEVKRTTYCQAVVYILEP